MHIILELPPNPLILGNLLQLFESAAGRRLHGTIGKGRYRNCIPPNKGVKKKAPGG